METLIKDVAGLISTLLHRVDIQALCCTCKHNREMFTFEDIIGQHFLSIRKIFLFKDYVVNKKSFQKMLILEYIVINKDMREYLKFPHKNDSDARILKKWLSSDPSKIECVEGRGVCIPLPNPIPGRCHRMIYYGKRRGNMCNKKIYKSGTCYTHYKKSHNYTM